MHGDRIDRYQLLRVLGRGGMGVVYLANDTLLDREIALKVVHAELGGEQAETMVAFFQQEARNLAGLNHPGIVQIFDYSGLYSSTLYLVMEYVPGCNLGEILGRSGPLSPLCISHLGRAIAGTLAYAHDHGIIHQDLKPENVLLTHEGRLKLTDFGISRRHGGRASGQPQIIVGTPAYMAPEQSAGLSVDGRTDVFSLGATLYTLASGTSPAQGDTAGQIIEALSRGDFPSLIERVPGVPAALNSIIMQALAASPADRYPDAMAMAAALSTLIGVATPSADDVPRVPVELLPSLTAPPPTTSAIEGFGQNPDQSSGADAGFADTKAPWSAEETREVAPIALDAVSTPTTPGTHAALTPGAPADAAPYGVAATEAATGAATETATGPPRSPRQTAPARAGRMNDTIRERPSTATKLWAAADGPPRLLGRFQLIRKLGTGAVGEMWLAEDHLHGAEWVAMKLFRPSRGASLDAFRAEFRDLASLRHPNLARIRDFGVMTERSDGGQVAYYIMDYLEAPDIRRAAKNASRETIFEMIVQLSRALVFLHDKTGRPHLGIKPENILVVDSGDGRPSVVLTDPGNSTEKLRQVQRGDRTSLPYAAPETLGGWTPSTRADLYSLGVVAYELLAGRRPFAARTPELLRAAHLSQTPPDLQMLVPGLAGPVAEVIHRFLAKDSGTRPSGAEAWIRAVNTVVVPPYPIETEATRIGRFSSAPWVGRKAALDQTLATFRAAMEDGSRSERTLLIRGERGVGKARLLEELARTAQLEGALVIRARPAVDDGKPYGPLVPLLNAAWARGAVRDAPAEHRRILRLIVGATSAAPLQTGGAKGRPVTQANANDQVDPGVVAELLVAGIRRPTILMLYGVDRMDGATLEAVSRASRLLAPLGGLEDESLPPVLMALTTRSFPEGAPAAHAGARLDSAHTITLAPLKPAAVDEMLRSVFGGQPLDAGALATLHRVTGGNPGDVQDVLYTMIEAGDLTHDGSRWAVRPNVAVPLPRSIEDALRRRLTHLSVPERDLVEALSVFEAPVPANFLDSMGPAVAAAAQPLVAREVLTRRVVQEEECLQFSHARVREALLQQLTPAAREARHRQAASWLEATRPAEEIVEALARHWQAGGRPERALSFLEEAAERTAAAGDLERTIRWYRDALKVLPEAGLGVLRRLKTEAKIQRRLGDACRSAGLLDPAEAALERLLVIGRDLEDASMTTTALDKLAIVMIDAGRFEDASAFARQCHDLATQTRDIRGQAMALRLLGTITSAVRGPGAGIPELQRALEVTGDDPDLLDVRARIAVTVSYSFTMAGQPDEGVKWARWGLQLVRTRPLFEMEVSLLINLSLAAFTAGRPQQALDAARDAMVLSHTKGLTRYYALAVGNMGDCLRILGQFEQAEALLRKALRHTYTVGESGRVIARLTELAALNLDRGTPHQCAPYLREAWRLSATTRDADATAKTALAELRLRLWCGVEGLRTSRVPTSELLRDVAERSRSTTDDALRVRALTLIATAAANVDPEAAREAGLQAYAVARRLSESSLPLAADVAVALGSVLEATGARDEAAALRDETRRALVGCVSTIESAALEATFRAVPAHAELLAIA